MQLMGIQAVIDYREEKRQLNLELWRERNLGKSRNRYFAPYSRVVYEMGREDYYEEESLLAVGFFDIPNVLD